MTPFDWDDLKVLRAILEEQSLSRAAVRLGVSQPTVGRRLSDLEERVGAPLVERTPMGCVPTPLGASFRPMLDAMQQGVDGIEQLTKTSGRSLKGKVRVACGEVVGRLLMRHAAALLEGAPELQLEIVAGMTNVNLERGDADIAVRARAPKQSNLRAKKITRAQFAVYGSHAYVEAHPEAFTEERYEKCTWVSFDADQPNVPSWKWLRERLPREPAVRGSATSLIMEAVASGAGLAVMSSVLAESDPRFVRTSEPIEALSFETYLVSHTRSRRVPRVRYVIDAVVALLSGS